MTTMSTDTAQQQISELNVEIRDLRQELAFFRRFIADLTQQSVVSDVDKSKATNFKNFIGPLRLEIAQLCEQRKALWQLRRDE